MKGSIQAETPSRVYLGDLFVVVTAGIGLLLSTLDTGIINVAIPTLVAVFHSTITGIAWTVTLYTLVLTGTIVLFGRVSDRIGHLKVYTLGLVVFASSSALCGFSQSAAELIGFRIVQGIGAAMLQATSVAIITTMIPLSRRASALGTLGILMGLGPVLGPSVGGALISLVSWRWIFWLNIPIALVALIGCGRLKQLTQEVPKFAGLNVPGNLLLSLSVLTLLEAVSIWSTAGASSAKTWGLLGFFVAFMVTFVLRELRVSHPILDLRLFHKGDFTVSMLAVFFFGGATSLGFIIPPYFFESVQHLAPWKSGLVNMSAPLGLMLLSKVSGNLMGKIGVKSLMVTGLSIMVLSYGILSQMTANWTPMLMAGLLFLYGLGSGLFVPANLATIMGAVGIEGQGTIGAVQRMVQNLGIAVATAITAAFIRIHTRQGAAGLMLGFREAWAYAATTLFASLGVFAVLFTKNRIIANLNAKYK